VRRAGVVALVSVLSAAIAIQHASGQARNWPTERPPKPLAPRGVKFPAYTTRTLPNGLQVVVVRHHEQPAVSLRLIVRAGSAHDPENKPGVASLTAAVLDQGTPAKNAKQIAETIDNVGGALGVGAGTDLSFVNVLVMKDSFELALNLASEIVRNPAFAAEEVERQKQQVLSGLQVSYQDPDYVAGVVFDRLVYGFHPYGRPGSGMPESIAQITRDDLVAFHQRNFVPNNAILGVVGDVTEEEAFGGAEKAFGTWQKRDVDTAAFSDPPPATRRVIVVDRPGAVQTEIRAGHVAIPRKHPDYMALNLAVKILGGEGSNRLHRVLRSERGLTYGASADMETLKQSGDIVAETDTRSDATGEALRLIVEQFWELQRERVAERELADAKAYLAGSFPLTIETPDAIALQVLNAIFYGLDLADLQTFRERVNAVTVDDIQRVARTYLRPDRLSIVLVGDASKFADQLRGAGFPTYERVSLAELDLKSATFKRGGAGAPTLDKGAGAAPPEGARAPADPKARALVMKAIDAKGGIEKLRRLKTITATADTVLTLPQGPVQAQTTTYIEYPDRFVVEARTPMGRLVQAYVDGDAWIVTPGGTQPAPEPMKREFRSGARRDVAALLMRVANAIGTGSGEGVTLRPVPDAKSDDGKALQGVEITTADLDHPISLYIDPETGLVRKVTYRAQGPAGPENAEEEFGDYRPVDGLLVAFKASVRRNGLNVFERTVTEYKLNTPIDPSVFKKP
jgi:zinc protease